MEGFYWRLLPSLPLASAPVKAGTASSQTRRRRHRRSVCCYRFARVT